MLDYLKAARVCCALLTLSVGISTQSVAAETVDQLGEAIRELRSDVNELRVSNTDLIQQNRALRADLEGLREDVEEHGRRRLRTDDALSCINQDTSNAQNIYFDGCNVHIRAGTTLTEDTNGLGNLIVGYNRQPPKRDVPRSTRCKREKVARKIPRARRRGLAKVASDQAPRTKQPQHRRLQLKSVRGGSHNIIVGDGHEYSCYGGIVAGYENKIHGAYASAVGGSDNEAAEEQAATFGGSKNVASGYEAVVFGGYDNDATGLRAAVFGGTKAEASVAYSAVTSRWQEQRKNKERTEKYSVNTGE